jgi:hypothetical protein
LKYLLIIIFSYQNEDIKSPKVASHNESKLETQSTPIQSTTLNIQHSSDLESLAFNSLKDSTSPSHDNNRTLKVTHTLPVSLADSSPVQPVVSSNNFWALSDVPTMLSCTSSTSSTLLPSLSYVAASTLSTPAVSTTMGVPIEYLVSKDCTGFPPPLEAKVIAFNNDSEIPEYPSSNNSKSLFFKTESQMNPAILDNISLHSIHPDGILEPNELQSLHDKNSKNQSSSQSVVKQGDKICDKSKDDHKHTPLIKPAASSNSNFQRRSVIVPNKNRVQNKLSGMYLFF